MSDAENPFDALIEKIDGGTLTKPDVEKIKQDLLSLFQYAKNESLLRGPELRQLLDKVKTQAKQFDIVIPDSKAVETLIGKVDEKERTHEQKKKDGKGENYR